MVGLELRITSNLALREPLLMAVAFYISDGSLIKVISSKPLIFSVGSLVGGKIPLYKHDVLGEVGS